ncbi:MAG: class B sortase [Firmicutes bacterium]|nr:class B sortase [Bacillota bacterium]
MEKKKKKGDVLYKIVMAVLVVIILFSLYNIGKILYGYYQGNSQYEEVQEIAKVEEKEEGIDFSALKKANGDVKAWIYLEDTVIDYPVMQTTNNDYYLYHMFNGEENGAGSIFIDYRNENPFRDFVTVLHGHRMKDGSMFKPLVQYNDPEFYKTHKVIEITTPKKKYDCKVFAMATIPADSDFYQFYFYSDEDRQTYLNNLASWNEISTDVKVSIDDKIVMMSTCTAQLDDNRVCVFGKLTEAK